ncbi:MAG: GcrA family cell cycle regulator [Hyphomicrobiales bacterium]
MSWNDERVETLKKLWNQGLSASQIAGELGHGITRNAVIGKVHRLGLSGRTKSPSAPTSRQRKTTRAPSHPMGHSTMTRMRQASGRVTAGIGLPTMRGSLAISASLPMISSLIEYQPASIEDVVVPISERITLMELRESTCRWPFGDPSSVDFRFCGASSPAGTPYCEFHSKLAYQPSNDRRKGRP